MRMPTNENLRLGGDQDESVDILLQKLAKKGKKVKIVNDDGEEVDGVDTFGSPGGSYGNGNGSIA